MRTALLFLLLVCAAAAAPQLKSRTETTPPPTPADAGRVSILPAGTKIPIALKQPVSTKAAQPGDAIYAETTFPIVAAGRVVIPAGTYVQGVVDHVKRAGRIKGKAELQFHLTTLIYPNGYTLDMAAAVDQVPGSPDSHMKEPGTVAHDSEKGADLERVGRAASEGAAIGGMAGAVSGNVRGIGVGGLSGIAVGTAIAILTRGTDVRFETGTVVDVALTHAIAIDREQAIRPAQ